MGREENFKRGKFDTLKETLIGGNIGKENMEEEKHMEKVMEENFKGRKMRYGKGNLEEGKERNVRGNFF